MRALVTAVVAAIEGCAAAVASLAAIAIPAALLWVVTFGIAAEPQDVAAAVAGVWLLAHFVPMQFALSQESMLTLGLGSDPISFTLSLVPLAVTLVTVAFAVRAGIRLSHRGRRGAAGLLGGAVGFAAVTFGVVTIADTFNSWTVTLATLTPTLVYLVTGVAAFVIAAAISHEHWWSVCVRGMQRGIEYLGVHHGVAAFPARAATAARLAVGSVAGAVGVAAVALAVAFAVGFADVIALAQALQLDAVGSLLLFVAQFALIPTGVIWALAWMSGAGFTVGGTFSPFADTASSLPSLPMLGALPGDWGAFGAVAPTLLVLVNLAVGILLTRGSELRRVSWQSALTLPVLAAAVTGLVVVGLCALGSGSLGPGRLEAVGPDLWLTGGWVAAEAAVGLLLGVTAARLDYSRVQSVLPEPIARWGAERAARGGAVGAFASARERDEDAETVDLSRVRDDLGTDGEDADSPTAPVIDLFEDVLHERDVNAGNADTNDTDVFDTEALSDDAPGDEGWVTGGLEADRLEPRVFDIETSTPAEGTALDVEAPEAPETPSTAEGNVLEDAEAIARAFAWDADAAGSNDTSAGESDPRGRAKRGRFGIPNWRSPRGKG